MDYRKFKKGDKVKRIKSNYGVTKVGEIYTISFIDGLCLSIEEDNLRTYDALYFELVEISNDIPEFLN